MADPLARPRPAARRSILAADDFLDRPISIMTHPSTKLLPLALALAFASLATAQAPSTKPTTRPTINPAHVLTPQTAEIDPATRALELESLQLELNKLNRELEQLKNMRGPGGVAKSILGDLTKRKISVPMTLVSAPRSKKPASRGVLRTPGMVKAEQPRSARLMTEVELGKVDKDVMFTVDRVPVTYTEYKQHLQYLKTSNPGADEDNLPTMAMTNLITARAARAMADDQVEPALNVMRAVQQQIKDENEPFADLARQFSEDPSSKSAGGDIGFFGRGQLSPLYEQAAFSMKVGEISDLVQTSFGFHLIMVTAIEKGETPAQTKVKTSHILRRFQAVGVENRVRSGLCDIAFAKEENLKLAPAPYGVK